MHSEYAPLEAGTAASGLPDLAYTRHGRRGAPPLVLLHGIGHRGRAWAPVIETLAQDYDVIVPDLSGFGRSPAFAGGVPYDMENATAHLLGQFERWGVSKPHVAGNSLGGGIALELGARGLVASVTALSPAGFFGRLDRFQALGALMLLRIATLITPKAVLRAMAHNAAARRAIGWLLYAHPERHDARTTYGDAIALKYATAFERTAAAGVTYRFDSQVPVPTTIAWGTKDRILPYAQSATARRRLPAAEHVDLPGCGHVPMIDDPDLVARVIDVTARGARQHTPAA